MPSPEPASTSSACQPMQCFLMQVTGVHSSTTVEGTSASHTTALVHVQHYICIGRNDDCRYHTLVSLCLSAHAMFLDAGDMFTQQQHS